MTQDIQLFNATVRDNLTLFDRTISDRRISSVLHEIGLQDWCASLAAGLDTVLDSGGRDISAGQAQLLAFARVFLRDPGLVILPAYDPAAASRLAQVTDWVPALATV